MSGAFLDHLVASDVENAQFLVTAGCGQKGTIIVPGQGLDDFRVTCHFLFLLALFNIPQLDGQIGARGRQDIRGCGMEHNMANLTVSARTDCIL